jgi:hypothetical protein
MLMASPCVARACPADNGGPIEQSIPGPTDAIGASNYPLRGGKHNAYRLRHKSMATEILG